MRRLLLLLMALLLVSGPSVVSFAPEAYARVGPKQGGRIYNPKRLRKKATRKRRGRLLKETRKAPPFKERQPARRRALIPNPEKTSRGGRGYIRRGQYYYQTPSQIRVGGNPKRRIERVTIPDPKTGR